MSDRIEIRGLRLHARHGVFPEERALGQEFVLDIAAELDLSAAIGSDDLRDSVSYAEMVAVARAAFTEKSHQLIESAGGAVIAALLAAFPRLDRVMITVSKPSAPIDAVFDTVAVKIARGRHG